MERRILGRLRGDATEEFHASLGYMDLQVSCPLLYKQRLQISETQGKLIMRGLFPNLKLCFDFTHYCCYRSGLCQTGIVLCLVSFQYDQDLLTHGAGRGCQVWRRPSFHTGLSTPYLYCKQKVHSSLSFWQAGWSVRLLLHNTGPTKGAIMHLKKLMHHDIEKCVLSDCW